MKHIFWIFLFHKTVLASSAFNLSILAEPVALNPVQKLSYSQNYLFDQLHSSFYKLMPDYSLKPNLVKNCHRPSKLKVQCLLKNNLKFSNGHPIQCQNFLETFNQLIKTPNKNTQRLSNIEGFKKALEQNNINALQVKCLNTKVIEFKLSTEDPLFLYHFTDYSLSPYSTKAFSGAFMLQKWDLGSSITLIANPHSQTQPSLKEVRFYFIKNPSIALKMFEKNELQLLTYLPTEKIELYKNNIALKQFAMDRFDYIGLERLPEPQRQIITTSINYEGLKKIYSALGTPGCPPLSDHYYSPKKAPCHNFIDKPKATHSGKWSLTYSLAGGADISKGMQYIKNQVEKNTHQKINLNPVEPGQFIVALKNKDLQMYRRGVSLARPSCYEALEIFHSQSPRNYSKLNDTKLDQFISKLKSDENYCYKTTAYLLEKAYIIPLGPIHFSMLFNAKYKGLQVNPLNHMDLSTVKKK